MSPPLAPAPRAAAPLALALRLVALAVAADALACPPPCGPFCPMRSSAAVPPALDPKLEALGSFAPMVTEQLAALTTELEGTGPSGPFGEKCEKLSADLAALRADYAEALETLRSSDDFQALEYAAFTDEARARSSGGVLTAAEADAVVDFQVGMMKMVAGKGGPPSPPAGLDFDKLESMGDAKLLLAAAGARVTASPVKDTAAVKLDDEVGEALANLYSDHENLIELGSGFGSFDADGRAMYLDRVADVEARWKEFLERHGSDLSSASLLANDYMEQTDAFLKGTGLESIEEYLAVLAGAHRRMRE
eukprot:CAMPEP_0119290224 /NCGR_PEP_ID=MMETSP1329-20130426/40402_1 /TAXON_ID=114041 /ORGANISM="Genus nov. species nov., Strain RCC1024" /LENGTH=306 /DNA_ID=CAMNT_0007291039 /DNA_START=163 /DNA_END=1080 /DNA_ORIENTATION=+